MSKENSPSYEEIRNFNQEQRDRINKLRKAETDPNFWWVLYDSPLVSSEGSLKHSFNVCFSSVLPRELRGEPVPDIRVYIEKLLAEKEGKAKGVEFGGPADKLFRGFTPGFFEKTAGVVVNDLNPPASRAENHRVIEGDIFSQRTRSEVLNWFSNQPADLIFERMEGGLRYAPQDSRFMTNLFSQWYEMLSPGGVMFIQLPDRFYKLPPESEQFTEWADYINSNYAGHLYVQYYKDVMRFNKLEGAPEKLPYEKPWISEAIEDDEFN